MAQQAQLRRRVRTPEFYFTKHFDNSRLVKASDPVRVREMRVFSAAVAVLFSLIMIYGLQHFYAIESSYRVESEKQTLDQLREENRQLHLSEAELTQPGRIDQMARQLGLAEPQPGQVDLLLSARPDPRRSCSWLRSLLSAPPVAVDRAIWDARKANVGSRPTHPQPRSNTQRRAPQAVALLDRSASFFLLWACAISGRLFWLQIVRHQDFVERAEKQQQRTFEVAPRRGVLYDRNLRELAMTVLADSIYADPSEIADKQAAARTLAALVHTDPEDALTTPGRRLPRA